MYKIINLTNKRRNIRDKPSTNSSVIGSFDKFLEVKNIIKQFVIGNFTWLEFEYKNSIAFTAIKSNAIDLCEVRKIGFLEQCEFNIKEYNRLIYFPKRGFPFESENYYMLKLLWEINGDKILWTKEKGFDISEDIDSHSWILIINKNSKPLYLRIAESKTSFYIFVTNSMRFGEDNNPHVSCGCYKIQKDELNYFINKLYLDNVYP